MRSAPSRPQGDVPRKTRLPARSRRMVADQLDPGENLLDALFGNVQPKASAYVFFGAAGAATMKQYYIGLTLTDLVLVRLNMWGKPAEVTCKPREQVRLVKHRGKLLTDRLALEDPRMDTLKLDLPGTKKRKYKDLWMPFPRGSMLGTPVILESV